MQDILSFSTNHTRSSGSKLYHNFSPANLISNTYFFRLPRLWNSFPAIDTSLPVQVIKNQFLLTTLTQIIILLSIYYVPVLDSLNFRVQ